MTFNMKQMTPAHCNTYNLNKTDSPDPLVKTSRGMTNFIFVQSPIKKENGNDFFFPYDYSETFSFLQQHFISFFLVK